MTATLSHPVPGGVVVHSERIVVADYADGRRTALVPWWPTWSLHQRVLPSPS